MSGYFEQYGTLVTLSRACLKCALVGKNLAECEDCDLYVPFYITIYIKT